MGWGARRPLYAHRISFQDFRVPRSPYSCTEGGTLAQVTPDNVVLTTIKGARWAEGFVLRLQEIAGYTERASISFPGVRIERAWRCDLVERDQGELEIEPDGTLQVDVPAWGLATVRIVAVGKEN
jgi:alpha-mannosidase